MAGETKEKISVLVVIDAQNDFISGSLANSVAQERVPNIVEKIKAFNGDAIYFTVDTHYEDYLNTPEGKKLPIEHCIYGTEGWHIYSDILKTALEKAKEGVEIKVIPKKTFGSVESVKTPSLVEEVMALEKGNKIPKPMDIEICGFVTDICVVSNALTLKAFTYDFAEITVDSNCCAGTTEENHQAALNVMKSCQINVI